MRIYDYTMDSLYERENVYKEKEVARKPVEKRSKLQKDGVDVHVWDDEKVPNRVCGGIVLQ